MLYKVMPQIVTSYYNADEFIFDTDLPQEDFLNNMAKELSWQHLFEVLGELSQDGKKEFAKAREKGIYRLCGSTGKDIIEPTITVSSVSITELTGKEKAEFEKKHKSMLKRNESKLKNIPKDLSDEDIKKINAIIGKAERRN